LKRRKEVGKKWGEEKESKKNGRKGRGWCDLEVVASWHRWE